MAKAFTSVPVSRNIPHSRFNLSYNNKFASYFGQLIPAFVQEVIPGDSFKIGSQIAIRLQPLEAPMMSSIHFDMRYFFVPNRILDDDWEEFINYSVDSSGTEVVVAPPKHDCFNGLNNGIFFSSTGTMGVSDSLGLGIYTIASLTQFSLWNFFGLPLNMDKYNTSATFSTTVGDYCTNLHYVFNALDILPVAYPWRAYNSIYNYFYRDENIDSEVSLDSDQVQWSAMPKNDYFYSALPFAQKGPAPAISLNLNGAYGPVYLGTAHAHTGDTHSVTNFNSGDIYHPTSGSASSRNIDYIISGSTAPATSILGASSVKNKLNLSVTNNSATSGDTYAERGLWSEITNNASVTMSAEDFRNLFAVQEFMENLALCGSRYSEYIYSNFGVYTGDYRIGKPQYLGGFKNQILISEIAQTSASVSGQTAQGNLVGRGVGAGQGAIKRCNFTEHGYIIGIFRILPDIEYVPRGMDKKFIKQSVMDYYLPTFAHLGEQPIKKYELYTPALESALLASDLATKLDVNFGFQGIYSEYRHNKNIVTGYMTHQYSHWNLARNISPLGNDPANLALNSSFIKCIGNSSDWNRVFSSGNTEPPFFVSVANLVNASRCIPTYAVPSKIVR